MLGFHNRPPALCCALLAAWIALGAGCGDATRRGSGGHGGDGNAKGGASQAGATSAYAGAGGNSFGGSAGYHSHAGSGSDARPPWIPEFEENPGWKDSLTPLCDPHSGQTSSLGVWADERGVFALVADACIPVGRDLPSCTLEGRASEGATLAFNDGTGWRTLLDSESPYAELTGFPGGPAVLTRYDCGASFVDLESGTSRCSLPTPSDGNPPHVFALNAGHAYATSADQLLEFRSGSWKPIATLSEPINALWADEYVVYLAGEYQLYSWRPGAASVEALPDAPAARYTSVWGIKLDEVWFGNSVGQLVYYNGSSFRIEPVGRLGSENAIRALWGQGDEIFFATASEFGKLNGALPVPILGGLGRVGSNLETLQIRGMWGTSPKDVFLALEDSAFLGAACGASFLLWFDGNGFHRF